MYCALLTYIHTHMHTHTYTYTHTQHIHNTYTHIHTIHTTHIHTHTHTHTHTYTHTYHKHIHTQHTHNTHTTHIHTYTHITHTLTHTATFSDTLAQEDYALIHPEGHKEFMDLLFEKRRLLDTMSARPRDKHRGPLVDHYTNHSDHHGNHSEHHQHRNHTYTEQKCPGDQRCHGRSEDIVEHSRTTKPPGAQTKHPVPGGGGGFKPVYLNGCTQPCYCSACIGAMAASYCCVSGGAVLV